MDNIEISKRISELAKELTEENISELKRLYNDLKAIVLNTDDRAQKNSYSSLMNEIRYTLFNMIKSKNAVSSNESVRKMVSLLDIPGLMIDDLVDINHHVFIIGQSIRDFSRNKRAYLINDYLKEVNDFVFEEDNVRLVSNEKINIIKMLLETLNEEMAKLNLEGVGEYPYLFIKNNRLIYNTPKVHIYSSNSLFDIANTLMNGFAKNVEIAIEDSAKNFYIFGITIWDHKYAICKKDVTSWTLQETLNSKTKTLIK